MKKKRTSKFRREYGMTLVEMSERYGFTKHYIWALHLKGELHKFIEEQEKKEPVTSE